MNDILVGQRSHSYRIPASLTILGDDMPDYDAAIILRTNSEPLSFLPVVRGTCLIDSHMALLGPETMEQRLGHTFAPHRFNMALSLRLDESGAASRRGCIYGVMNIRRPAYARDWHTQWRSVRVRLRLSASIIEQGCGWPILGSAIALEWHQPSTRLIRSLLTG